MESNSPPIRCVNGCGFFGGAATNNLCSKCFKDSIFSSKIEPLDQNPPNSPSSSAEIQKPSSNRCKSCGKKVGLMGFSCRCGGVFCSMHRYSEKHGCEFDYQREGKDKIEKSNPIVKAEKIEKI